MDNQHEKISGYRDLSQAEIDLMNEAKELEAQVLAFHRKVEAVLLAQVQKGASDVEWLRVTDARAFDWHDLARADIEKGFMSLVRSIAQPQPRA